MDLDFFVAAHRAEWDELERLVRRARRPRRLSAAEVDRLVELYQRAAAALSTVRSRSPDLALIERLSGLVTRARAAVTGARDPSWLELGRFLAVTFPAAVYDRRRWCLATAAGWLLVALALGIWVAASPGVQLALLPPAQVRSLVGHDFAAYYRSAPAGAFAARVWTNNVLVAAASLTLGVLLGLPTLAVLAANAANVGVAGGLLAAHGRVGEFFVLVLPHGMLELSAVFVAAGTGLRLGWRVVDPGRLPRAQALAAEGRGAVTVALGVVVVLGVSGLLEAFVTPSPLPAWARIGLGALAEAGFLALVGLRGRAVARAPAEGAGVDAGAGGDLGEELAGATLPVA